MTMRLTARENSPLRRDNPLPPLAGRSAPNPKEIVEQVFAQTAKKMDAVFARAVTSARATK